MLDVLGIPFSVVTKAVSEEPQPGWSPAQTVQQLALRKARAVAQDYQDSLVLGADTLVVLEDRVLGKPSDPAEAREILESLSGKTHQVFTGLALAVLGLNRVVVGYEVTDVTFGDLMDFEIESYIATGSPMDKAGAYGIQEDLGATFVSSVRGDYYTVVGLPLHRLYRMLRDEFGDLLEFERRPSSPSTDTSIG